MYKIKDISDVSYTYLHTYIGYLKNIYLVCMDVTWEASPVGSSWTDARNFYNPKRRSRL